MGFVKQYSVMKLQQYQYQKKIWIFRVIFRVISGLYSGFSFVVVFVVLLTCIYLLSQKQLEDEVVL